MIKQEEPPSPRSSTRSPLFRIGRDSRGNWVVQDQSGLRGGLFVDRAEAMRFAMFETGRRPQAVIMVPEIIELDMTGKPGMTTGMATPRSTVHTGVQDQRRVA